MVPEHQEHPACPEERRLPLVLPDPPLVDAGAGVRLRPWAPTPSDVAALAAAWADPAIVAGGRVPGDGSAVAAARWIEEEPGRRRRGLALDLVVGPAAGGGDVLGEVGLRNVDGVRRRAEVGWWTAVPGRGRGVASAAARLLVGWALRGPMDLAQVWCRIDPSNTASARVAGAAGLARLGRAAGVEVWARAAAPSPPAGC